MLRWLVVSSARSRLLRPGAVHVAAVAATPRAPRLAGLTGSTDPFHRLCELPRFFSLAVKGLDRPQRRTLAVNDPVAWQGAVKPSLLRFLQLKKHLMVPVAFVVPHGDEAWPKAAWGYPLGKHAERLRKQWRDGGRKIDPTQREELDEMDFAWDITQYKWDRFVLPSLRSFHELNGHTDVPLFFRIPRSSDWPELLWDQYLGTTVKNMRGRGDFVQQVKADQDELERLNFCIDLVLCNHKRREKVVPANKARPDKVLGLMRNDPEWKWSERIMPALEAFRELNGHCRVPSSFVVPSDESWPKTSWDLKLGRIVNGMRSLGRFSTQVRRDKARLDELGFVWDTYEFEWSERIMPALETFHRLHGHCRVPVSFVVPLDENWPKLSWGLNLGTAVMSIRQGSYFTQVARSKTRLEELGFVWDFFEFEWSESIMPALETFHRLHGHCRVPNSFVVPSADNWPRLSWGLNLGYVVGGIRQGAYVSQVARSKTCLEALGFVWDIIGFRWSERIMPALKIFYQVHGRCRVPVAFQVPAKALWPKELHDLKLGNVVAGVRCRGSYFDQIARSLDLLEAIEFDSMIPVTTKWAERVEPMLATFEQLHGHRDVPRDFVIPSSLPWKEKDWGIQLGKLERKE